MYPYLSTSPKSQMLSFEPTQCGYWSTPILSSESTGLLTTQTTTQGLVVETTINGQSTLVIGTSSTEVFTYTQESEIPISTLAPSLLPSGWDFFSFFEAPMFLDPNFVDFPPPSGEVVSSAGAVALNVTYIEPVATQLSDGQHYLDLPTALLPWLASQSNIKSKFPYIEHCWTISGIGQPTVHVPVNQLTTTSTNIIELGGPASQTTTTAKTTAPVTSSTKSSAVVRTSTAPSVHSTPSTSDGSSPGTTTQSPSHTTGGSSPDTTQGNPPGTTKESSSGTTEGSSPGTTDGSAPGTTEGSSLGTTKGSSPEATETRPQTEQTTHNNVPTASSVEASAGVDTSPAQGTLTTSDDIGGLLGAISSVAQQESSTQGISRSAQVSETGSAQVTGAEQSSAPAGSPGPTQTATVASTSSAIGFIIGSQTASPGGPAVSSKGTLYSALPSGSGVQVVASGQTSTIYGSAASSGAVSVLQATVDGGSSAYIVGSQTISPAGSAVAVSGTTYSALPSGSGVQAVANGQTSTIQVSAASSGSASLIQVRGGSSAYIVGSQTVSPAGSAAVISGTTYSALASGSGLVVAASGTTSTISPSSGQGDLTTGAYGSTFVTEGQTITAGGIAATVSGTTYSVLPSGSGVQVIASGATSTLQQSSQDAGFATLPGGQVISTVALPATAPASITIDGKAFAYQEIAPSAVIIGSETLSVGGPAVTENGETLSLTSRSSSAVLVVNGTSSTALPATSSAQQLVTLGGQTYTAYAAGSSAVVVDGQTVSQGTATVIDGETVSLSGTDLVVASGTVTSTEGIGGAIMSGLGGTQVSAATASPSAPYTGGAASEVLRPLRAATCMLLVAGVALTL